eukprot:3405796-Prymnesium_polylepis.1
MQRRYTQGYLISLWTLFPKSTVLFLQRSWTYTDALSNVCIARSIQLYNVSWAQLSSKAKSLSSLSGAITLVLRPSLW